MALFRRRNEWRTPKSIPVEDWFAPVNAPPLFSPKQWPSFTPKPPSVDGVKYCTLLEARVLMTPVMMLVKLIVEPTPTSLNGSPHSKLVYCGVKSRRRRISPQLLPHQAQYGAAREREALASRGRRTAPTRRLIV